MPDSSAPTKIRKASGQTYTEPVARVTVGWDPAKIRMAERMAEGGSLRLATDLVVAMLGDDRLRGVAETLGGVCSLPMLFESGSRESTTDKDGVEQDPAAMALEGGDWWQLLPEETQAEMVVWGRVLGVAVANISEWRLDAETGRACPVVNVWSPRFAAWKEDDREWEIETREGKVRTNGADGSWVILTAYRQNKGWMVAPWRGLARLWMIKAYALVDWPDYGDKHAQAKRVLERSDYTTDGTTGQLAAVTLGEDDGKRLVREIHALGRSGTIRVPDGYALRLLESTARSDQTYRDQIELVNVAYAVTLLGQNLTTEVTAGAYASTSVHYLVQGERLRTIAEWLATGWHAKLLPWWNQYNWGETSRIPWARYDTKPPADRKADAERLATVAAAVGAFANASVPLDLTAIAEQYEIPIDLLAAQEAQQALTGKLVSMQCALNSGAQDPGGIIAESIAKKPPDDQLDEGQDYLDDLQDAAVIKSSKMLRPHVNELVAMVKAAGAEAAETEEARVAALKRLREQVLKAYDGMDPANYANTVERVEMLASMAGSYSATTEI